MRFTVLTTFPDEWRPDLLWLVLLSSADDLRVLTQLRDAGLSNIYILTEKKEVQEASPYPTIFAQARELEPGDVVAVTPGGSKLQILYRESDLHHTVFLTNQCNSLCVMCSQPPTRHDDSWLVEEAKQVAAHMRRSPEVLGFTGGEPLLLREALREVLEVFACEHPATRFDVLTNGRLFSDRRLAEKLLTALPARVSWMVPLYGHTDFLHDHVVQAEGAFDETIDGLLTLQEFAQPIQLRIVLIKPVLRILPELCRFITSNLPFVREVALMGCEPIGYALANRETCEVDLAEWTGTLAQAVRRLTQANILPVLMNVPLCALPSNLRMYAHRSISDWKQIYAPECEECQLRENCCGLFAWANRGWRPTVLRPIREAIIR